MTGEERRILLQRIRRRIAEHNDIVYMQAEQHEKDCAGDCKVCQAEARYIDEELRRKAKLGEEVRLSSVLNELLFDEDLASDACMNADNERDPKLSNIQSVNNKQADDKNNTVGIEELNLAVHLESTVRKYGINNTDELYDVLKDDPVSMKKKLRGGYKYLVEKLKELGYEITAEMG